MAYPEHLANRIREKLADLPNIIEKEMMGGLTFMYNDKMLVGIFRGELMCRVGPDFQEDAVEKHGAREMEFGGRSMKGYVLVEDASIQRNQDFNYWIDLAIAYNPKAKSLKKKK